MANQVTDQDIKSFVEKVEKSLAHLKSADVRDLTENLEDALREKRSDEGESFGLPNPQSYANELVEAAGLTNSNPEVSQISKTLIRLFRILTAYLTSFGPAWAILRGYLLYSVAYGFLMYGGIRELPGNVTDSFVLLTSIGISVWLNAKKYRILSLAGIGLNVAILLILVPTFSLSIQQKINDYRYYQQTRNLENTIIDSAGNLHTTACAYDELGNRLLMATLTDPAGSTLLTIPRFNSGWQCPSMRR